MKTGMRKMNQPGIEVVDFEKTNRIPEIKKLQMCKKRFMENKTNIWYEYVPESYHGQEVPLVVQVHGGGHDGKRWANLTIWHELAEQKGFIVIYPNSPEYGCWPCEDADIQYLYDLIQHICGKYAIDRSRIYMQGMSNGDMMTLAFSMKHPEILAAAAYMSGPSAEEVLDGDRPTAALPIMQMRGELDVNWHLTPEVEDVYAMRYQINDLNRDIWNEVNGITDKVPALCIQGKDNYLYYEGINAPTIVWEVQGMGHREPVYSAQILWDRLYPECKRGSGALEISDRVMQKKADEDLVIVAAGSNQVYCKGEIRSMGDPMVGTARMVLPAQCGHFCPVDLGEMTETEVMCVPAEFFQVVYDAKLNYNEAGDQVCITFEDGTKVKLLEDSLLMNVDGVYRSMQKPCILRCGVFLIPLGEFCQILWNKNVSMVDDVMCISDHYARLGRYTAQTMSKLLGGVTRPRKKEAKWR